MQKNYDIYWEDAAVGQATVHNYGLYCVINATVKLHVPNFYKLILRSNDMEMDLGLFVPSGDGYTLNKKIPLKHIPDSQYCFIIRLRNQIAEKDVPEIERLQSCILLKSEKNNFFNIIDRSEDQPGNDLNRECQHK